MMAASNTTASRATVQQLLQQMPDWKEVTAAGSHTAKYYHAAFTVPHQLNSLFLGNRIAMFNLLFNAASYTLLNATAIVKEIEEKAPGSYEN